MKEIPTFVIFGTLLFTIQLNILNMLICQAPEHTVTAPSSVVSLQSRGNAREAGPRWPKFDPKKDCHIVEGTSQCAPRLFIIGTPKGGTTTLFRYLKMHPQMVPPDEKEMRYFDFQIRFQKTYGTVKDYIGRFPKIKPGENKMTYEATPWYIFMPMTARLIHHYVPNAKIVAVLRNPIDRAWSHYHFDHLNGQGVNATFSEVAEMEMSKVESCRTKFEVYGFTEYIWSCFLFSYPKSGAYATFTGNAHWHTLIINGIYSELIRTYYKFFDKSSIYVVKSEDFFERTPEIMDEIIEFLGLDPYDYSFLEGRGNMNILNNDYEDMPPRIRKKLLNFYKEYNDDLAELTGINTTSWNV